MADIQPGAGLPPERAKALYERLRAYRNVVLERARDCSALTLPGLIPPLGATDQTDLPTPYQSIGARGVNNLASKLLLALFPPATPFFRLKIRNDVAEKLGARKSQVEALLSGIEQTVNDKVETSHVRPLASEIFKHLIVGGSALLHVPSHEQMRFFRLDQFCIARDCMDRPQCAVVMESTLSRSIRDDVATECKVNKADEKLKVDIYTKIEWDYTANKVTSYQEINDVEVPNSRGYRPVDKTEWIPLRWIAVPGRDYGRSHVEEYLGDLRSLEGLSESIVQFAAAAAKIVMLVHPNSTTSMRAINEAESGDAVVGSRNDVDILQLDKYADFQVASTVSERIEQRLSYAFLLQAGTTRQAERVTAEEIRATAQELEDTLGGVYTVQAQEFQLPLVSRFLASMTESKQIPPLPQGAVAPVVVTGFEALGRNQALNKLRSYLQDMTEIVGQEVLAQRLDVNEVALRFGTGYGIESPKDLWLTDEEIQKNTQMQAMQEAMTKAAPAAAGPIVKNALGQQ